MSKADAPTGQRILAGLAAGYLTYMVLRAVLRIIALEEPLPPGQSLLLTIGGAIVVGMIAAIWARPVPLVQFIAIVFLLGFVTSQALPLLVGRIVPEGIADGFLIYFALLGGILALAYWSVYRGGIDEIRRRVNL